MGWRDSFVYGNVVSNDYDVYVLNAKLNDSTKREYESIAIAGRSGNLHIDKKRFSNMTIPYSCAIINGADNHLNDLVAALIAEGSDVKLSDTIHPEYYRKATFTGNVKPRISRNRELAVFDLEFDCAPQKWLVSGETEISVSSAQTIHNPTLYASKPLIKVTGTGTLGIGGETITIASNAGYMIIDCELEDAYDSRTHSSLNSDITLSSGEFPVLHAGENGVTVSGVSVVITPRWWTI